MSHEHEHHEHAKEQAYAHHHGHAHHHHDEVWQEPTDAAGRSLSQALQSSFRVLTVIMIAVVLAFLATGLASINPSEYGLMKHFGRITGRVDQGLAYTWPYPVGEIQKIPKTLLNLELDNFWMFESPSDKTKPLDARQSQSNGLRPGWDGALFTGDRNLLHLKLKCTYSISDPIRYTMGLAAPKQTISDLIAAAVIQAGAVTTAESLQSSDTAVSDLVSNAKLEAQRRLDQLDAGVELQTLVVVDKTWPLKARPAYDEAQRKANEYQGTEKAARGKADSILQGVAGNNSRQLVGDMNDLIASKAYIRCVDSKAVEANPNDSAMNEAYKAYPQLLAEYDATTDAAKREQLESELRGLLSRINVNYNLIGQYDDARDQTLKQTSPAARAEWDRKAQDILARIHRVLGSPATSGTVSQVISKARSEQQAVVIAAEARASEFEGQLSIFMDPAQRGLLVQSLWNATIEKVFSVPTAEIYTLPIGESKTIVRINRDPSIAKRVMMESIKSADKQNKASSGQGTP